MPIRIVGIDPDGNVVSESVMSDEVTQVTFIKETEAGVPVVGVEPEGFRLWSEESTGGGETTDPVNPAE